MVDQHLGISVPMLSSLSYLNLSNLSNLSYLSILAKSYLVCIIWQQYGTVGTVPYYFGLAGTVGTI